MPLVDPVFIITPEYEEADKIIEGEDTIGVDQGVFLVGNVIINGTFTVLGQLIII